jgi:hypothetical protein
MASNKEVNEVVGKVLGQDPEQIVCVSTVVLLTDGNIVIGGPAPLICLAHNVVHKDDESFEDYNDDPLKGFIPDDQT